MIPNRYFHRLVLMAACTILGSIVYAQQIRKITAPVFRADKELKYPFAGGLDAPQFSAADLNRDGMQDLFVFDRQGYTSIPFITTFDGSEYGYEIDWDVLEHLPKLRQWALMYDFNGDDVDDLICSTQEPGVQGVDVYRGSEENNKIRFTRMAFDVGDFDVLYFKLAQGYTPLYVAWIDVPAIADVDGDGDTDILAFDPGGSYIHYFKNLGVDEGFGLDTFILEWEDECWGKIYEDAFSETILLSDSPGTCASGGIIGPRHAGSALAVHDLEGDGDMDLFVGDLASAKIVELINGGTAEQAWMTSQDPQFPSDDITVDIPFFVAPFVHDVDHDAIPDLIAASNNTSFSENYEVSWLYKNDGTGNFTLQEKALFVGEMLDFGSESKPAVFDYNADGLYDIIVGTGGYFTLEGDRDARLVLLENEGTHEQPMFRVVDEDYLNFSQFVSVPTWEFAPAAGDIDLDGDIDLLVGERNGGLFFLENIAGEGEPVEFNEPVYPYQGINVGSSSKPCLVDLNGDEMPDIVCGERTGNNDNEGRCSTLNYFQNLGSPGTAAFDADITQAPNTGCLGRVLFGAPTLPAYSAPEYVSTPDGILLVTGSETGVLRVYSNTENNFTGEYDLEDEGYGAIADGTRSVPVLAELDNDGFYEMILGNKRGGLTLYDTDMMVATTSSVEPTRDVAWRFYPNPTNGEVRLYGDSDELATVKVFDGTGKLLISHDQMISGDYLEIPGSPGVYFAVIQTDRDYYIERVIRL